MKIKTEDLRHAPKWARWQAIDEDTYDGAPDCVGPEHCVGQGPTELDAICNLLDQLKAYRAEKHPVALAEGW